MNPKRLIILCCLLALFVFSADSVYAQRNRKSVKNVSWQTSVNDSERGVVILGIRDKWGTLGSFTALYVVTAPSKKKFRARTTTTQDDWAYISFPDDFDGNPLASGTYTVVFYANGVIIGRDKFKFRP
jgi:hypothetical protein